MKETGLTGKRRSTTIAATPDDGNSQRKRRRRREEEEEDFEFPDPCSKFSTFFNSGIFIIYGSFSRRFVYLCLSTKQTPICLHSHHF